MAIDDNTVYGLTGAQIKELPRKIGSVGSYSTSEQDTGATWIDGKKIYKKTFTKTGIVHNSDNAITHGIEGLEQVVDFSGMLKAGSNFYLVPRVTPSNLNQVVEPQITPSVINLVTIDGASFDSAVVTLWYTKSS